MAETVLAAQLYTIREFMKTPADMAKSLKKIKEIGYDAVQLSGHGPVADEEMKKMLDDAGLVVCATHTSYQLMRDEPQKVIDQHLLWGCMNPAIGGLPGEYRNAEGYSKFAREASKVGARLAEAGMTFSYHNHSFELEKHGDRTGLQILYEDSDPKYFFSEIDTYWVQHGGGDPAAWIRSLKGRAKLVHFKDMAIKGHEQRFAEIGEGNLNWPGILDACKEAGVEWHIVEQDRTYDLHPFESLAISLKNLKAMGLK
ncbi:TIM barrel protein [Candidatus Poribacteria bacterium]|nr:TIM barrel protein [Candidatus Poribacteria bacterium]